MTTVVSFAGRYGRPGLWWASVRCTTFPVALFVSMLLLLPAIVQAQQWGRTVLTDPTGYLVFVPGGALYAASIGPDGTTAAIYKSADNGATWEKSYQLNWWPKSMTAAPNGKVFALSDLMTADGSGGVIAWHSLLVSENGSDWNEYVLDRDDYPGAAYIMRADSNSNVYISGVPKIIRSNANWEEWELLNDDSDGNLFDDDFKEMIWLSSAPNGDLFGVAGFGNGGKIFRNRRLHGVDHWERVFTPDMSYEYIGMVAVSPGGAYIASVEGGVIRSMDSGATWTRTSVFTGPDANMVLDITASTPDGVYGVQAGTRGIYRSTDDGATWVPVVNGLPVNAHVLDIVHKPGVGLYAATNMGVYMLSATSGVAPPVAAMASGVTVLGPTPNPVASSTHMRVQLQRSMHVTAGLYTGDGQKVRDLFAGELDEGQHTLQIEVGGLASGVYYIQLQGGEDTIVRKLVVAR